LASPAVVVFAVALAVWWIQAIVIPLAGGRDLATYLGAYIQLGWAHPADLGYVLGRTPLSPLVMGGILQLANGWPSRLFPSSTRSRSSPGSPRHGGSAQRRAS
jgi:hypothetical protein